MIVRWWRNAPWLTVCTGIALLILLALGTWQLQRLQWKQAMLAEVEAGLSAPPLTLPADSGRLAASNYRLVTVKGRFLHDKAQHLGPRQYQHQPGVHLLTPMTLTDGRILLVNRGWIPSAAGAQVEIDRPSPPTTVTGVLRTSFAKGYFTPDYDAAAELWFWYDLAGMAKETGLPLLPAVLEADAAGNDGSGYPIGGVVELNIANRHLQYALTWYSLAIVLISVFVVFQKQRSRP